MNFLDRKYCWQCKTWHPLCKCCCSNTAVLSVEQAEGFVKVRAACPLLLCTARQFSFQLEAATPNLHPSGATAAAPGAACTGAPEAFRSRIYTRAGACQRLASVCPGLKGDVYRPLYGSAPQGSLHKEDIRTALQVCPDLLTWHTEVRGANVS